MAPATDGERATTETPGRPDVPFFNLIGLRIVELGDDMATCELNCGSWIDGIHELGIPAAMVALADCALAYATVRVNDGSTVSVSLHIDYRRPAPPPGALLRSTTRAWKLDHGFAYSEGPIVDAEGEVVASTSLRALSMPAAQMGFAPAGTERGRQPLPTPFPSVWVAPHLLPPGLARLVATELARRCALGAVSIGEGEAEFTAVPPDEFARTGGVVHGGAVGWLGHLALAGVALTALPIGPGGEPPRRLDFHIDYLRPIAVGAPVVMRSRIQHRSRRVAVITAEVVNADGRVAALARESCLLT